MSIFSHLQRARQKAVINSMMGKRYAKQQQLQSVLTVLYDKIDKGAIALTPKQRDEINRMRLEYATRSRQLLEEYQQKEIDVIEDLSNKFGYEIAKPYPVNNN